MNQVGLCYAGSVKKALLNVGVLELQGWCLPGPRCVPGYWPPCLLSCLGESHCLPSQRASLQEQPFFSASLGVDPGNREECAGGPMEQFEPEFRPRTNPMACKMQGLAVRRGSQRCIICNPEHGKQAVMKSHRGSWAPWSHQVTWLRLPSRRAGLFPWKGKSWPGKKPSDTHDT